MTHSNQPENMFGKTVDARRYEPPQLDLSDCNSSRTMMIELAGEGKTVLEIGTSTGYMSRVLKERGNTVVGVEVDPRAASIAKQYCDRLLNADIESLLLGDTLEKNYFDVVILGDVLEHLKWPDKVIEQLKSHLRPGGYLVVSMPNVAHGDVILNLFAGKFPYHDSGLLDITHLRFFGLEDVVKLFDSAGYQICNLRTVRVDVGCTETSPDLSAVPEELILGVKSLPHANIYQFVFKAFRADECREPLQLEEVGLKGSFEAFTTEVRRLRAENSRLDAYLARLQPEFEEKAAWANELNAELSQAQSTIRETEFKVRNLQSKIEEWSALWSKATRWKRALVFSMLAPLDWMVGIVIVAAELFGRVLRRIGRRKVPLIAPPDSNRCSIVIVTWEGKDLLAESLPPLLKAVRFHGGEHEIVVVDNASTDGTEEFLRNHFPEVRVIRNLHNEYFSGGNNLGVREAKNDVIVLLNNDMTVHEDFLAPLLEGFREPDVFAVASQVFLADPHKPREETGKTRATFNGCDLDWKHDSISPSDEEQKYVPVFWGHGGAVALDRQKFLWLGGFDRLYDPFYVEDADLSYQAWKVGWQCLLAVNSKVIHKHRSSTKRFGTQFTAQIVRRNHELFIWKTFGDLPKLLKHFLRAFRRRIQRAGVPGIGIRAELRPLLGAAKRLPGVVSRRLRLARWVVRTDQEILDITNPGAGASSEEGDAAGAQSMSVWQDRVPGQRRILMVCAYLPCLGVHSGGNTMFNLIRTLSKRHRLTVLSYYEQESEREFVPMLSQYCERLELVHRNQTLDAPNPFGLKPPEIVYEFYHKRMQRLVAEYLQTGLFDLIQCEFVQTGHFANVDLEIPAVLTNHELLSLAYLNSLKNAPWVSRRKIRALVSWMRMLNYEEKLLRRFAAVVVLTRPEREFLARYAPTVKVFDHATGVDCDFFFPAEDPPAKGSVLFVGNFRHAPNVGGMIWFLEKVWPKIRASCRDAQLYIVGGNPPPSIQEVHGRDGITVTGWVEDVRPYLQNAAVFVAPVFEGVGLRGKVLEAWAMKKAVVGTRLSFEALSAIDAQTCFLADDPEAFAARVGELLEKQDLASRMGNAARRLVEDSFSWDAFGAVYDGIYSEILGSRDRSPISLHSPVLEQEISQHEQRSG
jgi:GT2 family glycosyltransferase/glycosyltransferase involved in cell wall biosynthesis/SAM-dependent methyltransferase